MIDTDAITRMVEEQVAKTVKEQVNTVLGADEWLESLEQKILEYTQARILNKFANATAMPEILEAVKDSVAKLFAQGSIPGIDQFVDSTQIKLSVDQAIENFLQTAIEQFAQDPVWQARVEMLINQTIAYETISRLGSIDLNPVIKQHVDQGMEKFTNSILKSFSSTGIKDQATKTELTVMNDVVVVENCLTANSVEAVDSVRVQHLVVTGSINTDNESWSALASSISKRTLEQLTNEWNDKLVNQVVKQIQDHGIDFEQVLVAGVKVIDGNQLTGAVTESKLKSVGVLKTLTVSGAANFNNNTVNVLNKRLGINTDAPEKALSVWDEEVSIVIGKHKQNQAYIGTNRDQGLAFGVNREPQLEISAEGLTTVKKLRVGLHRISHETQVPGWSGNKGDIVFNANPGSDRVFAWVCLGAYRWQALKSAE
jgi:hypothetical protein